MSESIQEDIKLCILVLILMHAAVCILHDRIKP